jgi:NADH:ubiquinone oxidoreductase subunit C
MGQTSEVANELRVALKDSMIEVKAPRERRIFMRIKKASFQETVKRLINDFGFKHLSTITGVDLGDQIEVIYHFARDGAIELSVGVALPKNMPSIPTVSGLIPAASVYEREVHEFLGVSFEGNPNLSPLVLPEEWPKDVYPLRKERTFEELRQIGTKK